MNKAKDIQEGNKLIAGFMGRQNLKDLRPDIIRKNFWTDGLYSEDKAMFNPCYKRSPLDEDYAVTENLSYDSDWSLLIPVIKKLQGLNLPIDHQKWFLLYAHLVTADIDKAFVWVCETIHQYNCQSK